MKVDFSNVIDGWDEMSADEKVLAMQDYELPDNSNEITKLKSLLSKTNSEAADYKRKLKEKMSEDEAKKVEAEEERNRLEEEVKELRRNKQISEHKAELIQNGFGELAQEAAEALSNGDFPKFFELQKKANDNQRIAIENDLISKQPKLTNGDKVDPDVIKEEQEMALLRKYAGLK